MPKLNEIIRDELPEHLAFVPPVDDGDPDLPPAPDAGSSAGGIDDELPDEIIWDVMGGTVLRSGDKEDSGLRTIDLAPEPDAGSSAGGIDDELPDEIIWDVMGGTVLRSSDKEGASVQVIDVLPQVETSATGNDEPDVPDCIIWDIDGADVHAARLETADSFVFALEPPSEPNEPTRPDPGDAEGQSGGMERLEGFMTYDVTLPVLETIDVDLLLRQERSVVEEAEPGAREQAPATIPEFGGGEIILVDILGPPAVELDLC